MHDAILATMDNMVISSVEMAVKSSSVRQDWDQVRKSNTLIDGISWVTLGSCWSLVYWTQTQMRIDETPKEENFEDGDYPVLGPNYDRRTQAHQCSLSHRIFTFRNHSENFSTKFRKISATYPKKQYK